MPSVVVEVGSRPLSTLRLRVGHLALGHVTGDGWPQGPSVARQSKTEAAAGPCRLPSETLISAALLRPTLSLTCCLSESLCDRLARQI